MAEEDSTQTLQELAGEDPDLYAVLGVSESATQAEIRRAYRRLALQHHPDKVAPDANPADRTRAHTTFQKIAFAYAVLADSARRATYDASGATDESAHHSHGVDDWAEFYRTAYADAVSEAAIDKLRAEYKGSAEERQDLLRAYDMYEGDMDKVFETVMLSEVGTADGEGDEQRFAQIIREAIGKGEVPEHAKFTEESAQKKQKRRRRALREAREARQAQEKSDNDRSEKSTRKRKASPGVAGSEAQLLQLIQSRQRSRQRNQVAFLDALESKHEGKVKGKGRRKADMESAEPPEEAFEAMRDRQSKRKASKARDTPAVGTRKSSRHSKK
ncbi:DnaJ sub C member 9 [Ascosphaera acerosa]|nr:DnaJ sub C member 9 [Ascosphaera acerosa]